MTYVYDYMIHLHMCKCVYICMYVYTSNKFKKLA